MLKGRNSNQKRLLIAEITRAMVEIVGAAEDGVHVVIDEVDAENWGRGGLPLATPEEQADVVST